MIINLDSETPTDDATDLTEGANYSIYHAGGVVASVQIDGEWTVVYQSRATDAKVLLGLPGTSIRLALPAGQTDSAIAITQIA